MLNHLWLWRELKPGLVRSCIFIYTEIRDGQVDDRSFETFPLCGQGQERTWEYISGSVGGGTVDCRCWRSGVCTLKFSWARTFLGRTLYGLHAARVAYAIRGNETSFYFKEKKNKIYFKEIFYSVLGVVVHTVSSKTQEIKAGRIQGQPGLYSELQVRHVYTVRPCLKEEKQKKRKEERNIHGY